MDEKRSGRIGGIVDPRGRAAINPAAIEGMRTALGAHAQLLLDAGTVADCDACSLQGQPITDFAAIGERLVAVDGAFAAAWLDARGVLRLASDPIGHRRIYYTLLATGELIFASTLHGVLGTGLVARRLATRAVPVFLTFSYLPTEETLVEGVRVLPPGHRLEFDVGRGHLEIERYWELPGSPEMHTSETELRERLREELRAAVSRALPRGANEPVGFTLSGGIDSSLVVALARSLHAGPMTAYSISFGAEHRNELPWSELVARHCGIEHVVVDTSPVEVTRDFDATVGALSQPNGDPLTVPNTLLFRRASRDSRFLLNGEGGDPCFGGPKNAPMLLAELLGDGAAATDADARARSYLRAHQKCYDDLPAMLRPAVAAELREHPLEALVETWLREPRWPGLLDKLMAINVVFKGAHHILPKVDHLSFASGVCPRSPLFDRRVVELSFRIPASLKRRGAIEKYLLKEAVRDLLPVAILERPKSGMMVPVESWFQGPLRTFATERLLDGLAAWDLFDPAWLRNLLRGQLGGLRPRHGVKIWLLVTLESWLRTVLRGKT